MYSRFQLIKNYLRFRRRAMNSRGHGMHSPFVYQLIREVLNDRTAYPEYEVVESLRKQLLRDESVLQIRELGAGSATGAGTERTVASIARNAAKPRRLAQLLFRIARFYQSKQVLELGTSLGISTAYLSLAGNQRGTNVTTMEGSPEVAARARENFRQLGLSPQQVEGNFDDTLPAWIAAGHRPDLVFIDGNHRQEPSERYFRQLLPLVHNDTILVFDDIHWSPEMEQAWETIRSHTAVRCSVDLFFVGLVFFRDEFLEKRRFDVRF